MDKTTIEISKERKEQLRDVRLSHESNYDETIERLLGEDDTQFITEEKAREVAREEVNSLVVMEALQ